MCQGGKILHWLIQEGKTEQKYQIEVWIPKVFWLQLVKTWFSSLSLIPKTFQTQHPVFKLYLSFIFSLTNDFHLLQDLAHYNLRYISLTFHF